MPYDALYGVPAVVQVTVFPSPIAHTISETFAVAVTVTPPADAVAVFGPYVSAPLSVHR